MTHEEIESYGKRLKDILAKGKDSESDHNTAIYKELQELALEVGAWTRTATFLELIDNIHQALQTATMIDACRTAAKNVEVAKQAQRDASRSQQVAFWSMLAAWGAVVVNIAVAYIMAAMK